MKLGSKVLAARDYRWPVALRPYKDGGELYRDVTRQTLLGEGEGEAALSFVTRYFEIAAGGFSTLEHHQHPHSVVVLRGRGTVQLGERCFAIAPPTASTSRPDEVHQFRADQGETLGSSASSTASATGRCRCRCRGRSGRRHGSARPGGADSVPGPIGSRAMKRSRVVLLWLAAIAITVGSAAWQRRTGPSYPLRGSGDARRRVDPLPPAALAESPARLCRCGSAPRPASAAKSPGAATLRTSPCSG